MKPNPPEFDGKKYEQASAHQQEWGAKLITELALQGTERILDLGCGDGRLSAQLAQQVPQGEVVGIDASRGMIEVAQSRRRNNLRFVLKNIEDLDYADEFDVVFSNAALHWVKDHQRLLPKVGQALCPGGRLRFNFAGEGNCARFFAVMRQAIAVEEYAAHFAGFDWPWYMPGVEEYASLMAASGLKHPRVWGENADRYFATAEDMIKWIDQPSLVPFLACVPERSKAAFREYVIRHMLELTRQADGRCFETFRRIQVSAQNEVERRTLFSCSFRRNETHSAQGCAARATLG